MSMYYHQEYTFSLNSQATGLYYILLQSGKEDYSFKYLLQEE